MELSEKSKKGLTIGLIITVMVIILAAAFYFLGSTPKSEPPPNKSDTPDTPDTPIPAPLDCVQSDWGACSKTCGGGTQTRTIITQSANGGTACGPTSQNCNTHACPAPKVCHWLSNADWQWKPRPQYNATQCAAMNQCSTGGGCYEMR